MQSGFLAGMARLELADTRVKVWGLTTWRHPNIERTDLLYGFAVQKSSLYPTGFYCIISRTF